MGKVYWQKYMNIARTEIIVSRTNRYPVYDLGFRNKINREPMLAEHTRSLPCKHVYGEAHELKKEAFPRSTSRFRETTREVQVVALC